MTDKQIIEIASQFLTRGTHSDTGWCDIPDWTAEEEDLIKFAREIYSKAYSAGHRDGYDDGWDGKRVSTEMNMRDYGDD